MFEAYMPMQVEKIEKGYGSFITIYLKNEKIEGLFKLWIYLCNWDILKGDDLILSSSENDDKKVSNTIIKLKGSFLISIFEYNDDGDVVINVKFENGWNIELYSDTNYDPDDDFFMFYSPNNKEVVSYSSKKHFYRSFE
jgi:hypothetical protein